MLAKRVTYPFVPVEFSVAGPRYSFSESRVTTLSAVQLFVANRRDRRASPIRSRSLSFAFSARQLPSHLRRANALNVRPCRRLSKCRGGESNSEMRRSTWRFDLVSSSTGPLGAIFR